MAELKTGVDQLMELVRQEKKLSVAEAARKLSLPERTVQSWVDFLVEEHVLGIEYKFTTPYVYVNNEDRLNAAQEDEESYVLEDFRDVFYAYAKEKEMPQDKLVHLWREHLKRAVGAQKEYFVQECRRRGVAGAEELFEKYAEGVLHGA